MRSPSGMIHLAYVFGQVRKRLVDMEYKFAFQYMTAWRIIVSANIVIEIKFDNEQPIQHFVGPDREAFREHG